WQMQVARDAVELGRAARAQAKLKLRQPLGEAVVVAAEREREAIERLEQIVLDELNVKGLRYVSQADELGRFEVKPHYRGLAQRRGVAGRGPDLADAWRRRRAARRRQGARGLRGWRDARHHAQLRPRRGLGPRPDRGPRAADRRGTRLGREGRLELLHEPVLR